MKHLVNVAAVQLTILFLSLMTNKVAAEFLTTNDYATYGQVVLFTAMIGAFVTSGLQNCVVAPQVDTNASLQVYFLVALFVSLLLVVGSQLGLIEKYFLFDPLAYVPIIFIVFLPFIYQVFVYTQSIIINSDKRLNYVKFNVGNTLLCTCLIISSIAFDVFFLTVFVLLLRPGLLGLIKVRDYIEVLNLKSVSAFKFKVIKNSKIFGYLFYGIISTVSFLIFSTAVRLVISESQSFEFVGYFYTAQRLFELVLSVSLAYYSSYYFKKICNINDYGVITKTVLKYCLFSFVVFSVIGLTINLFAAEIVTILFSEKQLASTRFFVPLTVNMIFISLVYVVGFSLVAKASKLLLSTVEIFYVLCFFALVPVLKNIDIVWILPAVTIIKLIVNSLIFWRIFYGKK